MSVCRTLVCPQCGQDDIGIARFDPMYGDTMECYDCGVEFPDEYEPPFPDDY